MIARWKYRMWLTAIVVVLAALTSALLDNPAAQAQEGPEYEYVDLVMLYEQAPTNKEDEVAYRVQNIGTATATGVSVSFLVEDLEAPDDDLAGTPITDKRTENTTNQRFTWEIGTVLPGATSTALEFGTVLHSGHTTWDRVGVISATASSNEHEPGFLLANNDIKVYSFASSATGSTLHMKGSELMLLLKVSDLRPDAGGGVDFGLTANNFNSIADDTDHINLIADARVKVKLSKGLKFKETWNPPATEKSGGQSATWSPQDTDTDGTTATPPSQDIKIETQLTLNTLEEIPLEERCITVWVEDSKPPPSPGYALGSLTECLGDDPPVLFEEGGLDLFTLYPCVGVTPIAYPCRDDDSDSTADNGMEMVVSALLDNQQQTIRSSGIGRLDQGTELVDFGVRLRPESVVVKVKDPGGRAVDSSNNLAWWTRHTQGLEPTLNNSSQSSANWTEARWEIASVERPSNGHIHIFNEPRSFNIVNTNDKTQHPVGGGLATFANTLKVNFEIDVKFDTLGTYIVDFTQETRNNNGTTGDTSDDVDYLASGRYTFHVGPIAELEVADGGERSVHAPADKSALTVVALNNGPDTAPAARVTGLPKKAEIFHISQGS